MKKLLIATLAASAVGGAFATPVAYDYKASVKHMYERVQRNGNADVYVKYVKSSKFIGYFVQDFDGSSKLANRLADGSTPQTEKRGFLVLLNRSAERDYRQPKIMPAQLDVKACITRTRGTGTETRVAHVYEAYFYAGPFAGFNDLNKWNPEQDDGLDYLFNNISGGAPGVGFRTYGTAGSTLYLFGQHNTFNRFNNSANHNTWTDGPVLYDTTGGASGTLQAEVRAFGDAWLNGAGFGSGTASSTLCCGWATVGTGNNIFRTLSGNLKGGLFLCGIGNRPANVATGYFALGLEDLFKSDKAGANLAKIVQGDNIAAALEDDPADYVTWADGDIALSTTDVVSGSWAIRPSTRLAPVDLTDAEAAFFAGTEAVNPVTGPATSTIELLQFIKGANRALHRTYPLTTREEPRGRNGRATAGLISAEFVTMFL
jgi:hypothetical protein